MARDGLLVVAEDGLLAPVKAEFTALLEAEVLLESRAFLEPELFKAILGAKLAKLVRLAKFKATLEADMPVLEDAPGALCIAGILDAQSMAVLVEAVLVMAVL